MKPDEPLGHILARLPEKKMNRSAMISIGAFAFVSGAQAEEAQTYQGRGSQRGWSAPSPASPSVRRRGLLPSDSPTQMAGRCPVFARQKRIQCPSGDSLARKSQTGGSLRVRR